MAERRLLEKVNHLKTPFVPKLQAFALLKEFKQRKSSFACINYPDINKKDIGVIDITSLFEMMALYFSSIQV